MNDGEAIMADACANKAELSGLKTAMANDKKLAALLTMPGAELVNKYPEYLYFIKGIASDYTTVTLFDIIDAALTWHSPGHKTAACFMKTNDKITGFEAYVVYNGNVITIEMVSFIPKEQKDVIENNFEELLAKLIKKYRCVEWCAAMKNPANHFYETLTVKYNGEPPCTKGDITYYHIENKTDI
jgi:hypothetical protein